MHNLDDNELDRLSRDAAEHYEPGAAPPAWDGLQKRLDREMPTRKEGKDRKYWLLLLLLLLVGGGSALWYNSQNQHLETVPAAAENKEASGNDDSEKTVKDVAQSTAAGANTDASNNASAEGSSSASPDRNANAAAAPNKNGNAGQEDANKESFERSKQPQVNKDRSNELIAGSAGGRNINKNQPENGAGNVATNGRNKSGKNGKQPNANGVGAEDPGLSTDVSFYHVIGVNAVSNDFSFAQINNTNPRLNHSDAVTSYATPLKDQKSGENKLRPFEFGIVVGPDKSQVHGTKADQTGYNLGLTFGFNLSKRWQINTGLVYNKKYYNAEGEDYHAPKGYWTDTLYLSMVNGRCYMWDLPINVRYNILAKKNYSVFASAGISTYFMKTEDYGYHYYDYTGQYGYKYKSTPTNDAYWFGVGNLSAGYEQNFGAFSVQAEPYLKFALRGVGLGSLDLNSYGMNIGLKYKPNWSIKKTNPQHK
jgi:cytoskeletal protein RodZ